MNQLVKNILVAVLMAVSVVSFTPTVWAGPKVGDAALGKLGEVVPNTGVEEGDLAAMAGQIIKGALTAVGLIFFALMVYAGFLWMTAHGDEDHVTKAKGTIKASIIGLAVVLSSYAITNIVSTRLIGSGGGGTPGGGDPTGPVGCCIDWRTTSGDVDRGIPVDELMSYEQCEVLGTTRSGSGDQLAGSKGRGYWEFFYEDELSGSRPGLTLAEKCFEKQANYDTVDVIPDRIYSDNDDENAVEEYLDNQ